MLVILDAAEDIQHTWSAQCGRDLEVTEERAPSLMEPGEADKILENSSNTNMSIFNVMLKVGQTYMISTLILL